MENNKKILLLLPSNYGTIARRAFDLYNNLVLNNADVSVVIFQKKKKNGFDFSKEYVFNYKTFPLLKFIHQAIWLRKIKNQNQPEITISVLNACSSVNVLSGGNEYKVGMFRAPFEQSKNWKRIPYFLNKVSFRFIYPKLDKLYCVSEGVKQSILKHYPNFNKNKLETVYNMFDFERIKNLSRETLTENYFQNNKIIISVGRIDSGKCQMRILRAFAMMKNINLKNNIKIVLIGSTNFSYFDNLKDLISELGLEEIVVLLGEQSNPYKYLRNSDLFVFSSRQEGLPGALIEPLVLGIPVVTTNASLGVWEILASENHYDQHLRTNFNTPAGIITPNLDSSNIENEQLNISFLSKAIEYMLEKQDLRFDFGCVDRFRPDKIIDKYLNPLK